MNAGKILVVDDIETNRKLLQKMLLRMADYSVVEAKDGRDAISVFELEKPDLILMDINMPEMSGFESASEIKRISGDNHIPIIFVTALSAESSLANALASGGDDFISKPFDVDVLQSKVHAHLRIRALNQQVQNKNSELKVVNSGLAREQDLIEHFFESALKQSCLDERFINYHMSSLSAFNGDIFLVERSPQGGLYIVLGDFTGHGLTAAMGTLPVAMIFFKMVSENSAVTDIARELNDQLYKLMPTSMFFAATLLELNAQGDILTAWMGGMPESFWLGGDGEFKGLIESRHMPLGILSDAEFDAATEIFSVDEDDTFYLYSDGVIEAEDADGKMFGSERLKQVLVDNKDNRIEKIINSLNDFTDEGVQTDDTTIVELSCYKAPEFDDLVKPSAQNNSLLPWKMSTSLTAIELQEKEQAAHISEIVGSLPILQKEKGVIGVLLSEIYLNALDYSILNLDSSGKNTEEGFSKFYELREEKLNNLTDAFINLDFNYIPESGEQRLVIRIEDSGTGYQGHTPDDTENKLHGRGLDIITSLCESVMFSNDGKTLELVYKF